MLISTFKKMLKHVHLNIALKKYASPFQVFEQLRFGEWSKACTMKQLKTLTQGPSATGPVWHYLGIGLADDSHLVGLLSDVKGQFMSEWWDNSSDAGPKRRPRATFNEATPDLKVLRASETTVKSFGCNKLQQILVNVSPKPLPEDGGPLT